MFFPSSTKFINPRFSHEKNTETVVDWSGYLSWEDQIRKTYGDEKVDGDDHLNKIYGEAYLGKIYGYGNILKTPKTIQIVKGEKLKCELIRRLLSNNGKTTHLVRFKKGVLQDEPVDFDFLSEKYLLVCCFDVPMFSETEIATKCRSLIDAYDELSQLGYPFELIVVANMITDVAAYDLKAAFDHFYSAFSCLAIPFSDFETRDYIRSCMTLSLNPCRNSAILVNPEGLILEDDTALIHFFFYGSEWTPFLPTTLDAIKKQDDVLRSKLDPMYSTEAFLSRLNHPIYSDYAIDDTVNEDEDGQEPLSLYGDILLCDPCLTLRRFDAAPDEADVDVFSTVLDLSRKYVGLYLFMDGEIMENIKAAHDHCLANNQQLEILLVPMPFYDEPESYIKQLHEALRHLNIKSWFLFNCDNMVCRRLWRIFGQGRLSTDEKFIIIPPNCESGELCGREIITNFGVDQYPFTRTAILKQRLEYLRSLTPIFSSSLFNNCRMIQNGQELLKSEQLLQGKNVLLYLTWSQCDSYKPVKKHYPKIKAMGWELVFVLLDYTDRYWNKQWIDPVDCQNCPCLNLKEMPWPYILPCSATKASIKKQLFYAEDMKTDYLFAVGKDGKIVSRDVYHRLNADAGVTESLFDDVLEADLAFGLADIPLIDVF